ncbi:TetR/AcrR family transcriptional regulator [Microbulbifer rhizosphaerae]|uniref:AcrR family transcriptional regulator n=1 Tax=Microbulbifer rhizosphaerae TaxID=1562603 RepID=A0A7W4WBB9_9GAMM|nr:TetR/AcrR family transcriptional regulator [Microbulbifer rhizosphaerae]MBB3060426.1 AcrR family transcriptional regulator [Microbulbifer rhizosphaerae]
MSKIDKTAIVRAAEEVVRERGARKLTLDAVAAKCGLSKGGLLHHFSSKQVLLKAMVEKAIERELQIAAEFTDDRPGAGQGELQPRIDALFVMMEDEKSLPRALLAAVAEDPSLLEPIRAKEAKIRREACGASKDPELAQILLFAARGLFLGRVLGVMDPEDPVFERMRKRLLALAAEVE